MSTPGSPSSPRGLSVDDAGELRPRPCRRAEEPLDIAAREQGAVELEEPPGFRGHRCRSSAPSGGQEACGWAWPASSPATPPRARARAPEGRDGARRCSAAGTAGPRPGPASTAATVPGVNPWRGPPRDPWRGPPRDPVASNVCPPHRGNSNGADAPSAPESDHSSSYGPRNRSPLKWMRWSGASATQTSVSQAISGRYSRIEARSRKVVTKTRPALDAAKRSFS